MFPAQHILSLEMFHLNSVLIISNKKRESWALQKTSGQKIIWIHCICGKKVSKPRPPETEEPLIYIEETLDKIFY